MSAPAASAPLWLARHAAVQAPPGWCYGALDIPAQPQATQSAAAALAAALPPQLKGWRVCVSPQTRCQQLAQALCALRPDLPAPVTDARLREMSFGQWEGQPWSAVPRAALDAWLQDFAHARPGGGDSLHAFMQRVAAAWADWQASGQPALWITHAGVIRATSLLARGQGTPQRASDWPQDAAPLGGWRCVFAPSRLG